MYMYKYIYIYIYIYKNICKDNLPAMHAATCIMLYLRLIASVAVWVPGADCPSLYIYVYIYIYIYIY